MSDEVLDTLVKYGTGFQTKSIVALITDREFTDQAMDVVNPLYFESVANRWIIERTFWYFQHYRELPTWEVYSKEVAKITDVTLKQSVLAQIKNIYTIVRTNDMSDIQYIKDEFIEFCKNQALKQAVLKSAELLQAGKYDEIKVIVDKALHAGAERNIGHCWSDDLEMRITSAARNCIPTRWKVINDLLDGGLGAGELGCWLAPSGIGKSWIIQDLGQYAQSTGKTVVHYTFELSETYTALRYDCIATGIEPQQIKHHKEAVLDVIPKIGGRLYIKYFPTRTVSINAVRAHLQRMINLGLKPDIVLIDYADLMRSAEKADARHEELGFIYEEIRGVLGEYGLPGWTASQTQRSSLNDDVIEADKIAGSYAKIMVCDFVGSVSRKAADKLTNTARVHVIKNRFGQDGLTFPAHMDLAHGKIMIYDDNSPEGAMIKQKMASGEGVLKNMLANKLIDMHKTPPPDLG